MSDVAWTRLRNKVLDWTARPIRVWHHAAFRVPIAGVEVRLGIDPRRAENVLTWLMHRRIVDKNDVALAPEAPWEALERVHDRAYLQQLDDRDTVAHIVAVDPRVVSVAPLVEMWRRACGGTTEALKWAVANHGVGVVTSGGFHHARPDQGVGFCALNDVVVAIRDARVAGYEGRIVIVDLDAHPPDGIAACLDIDDRTDVISLGVASEWSVPDSVIDIRVPPGADDEAYLRAVEHLVANLPAADAAIVLCGADPLGGDRLGGLACTEDGLYRRDRRVLDALGDVPVVLLPAGGYTDAAWRVFASAVALSRGVRERPQPTFDPMLHRSRRFVRALDYTNYDEELSTAEIEEALGIPTSEPRVLGRYTRQGVEYALSRFGLLDILERMGFEGLTVEIRAHDWPHLIRVTADVEGKRETLMEVALSRMDFDSLDAVFIDWLTLRDPRVPFRSDRPQLPGQNAPGLGLSREVSLLLEAVGNAIGADVIAMVPSHFHVAWIAAPQTRGRSKGPGFQFLDPAHEGRFQALLRHLQGVPLQRASQVLAGPGVPHEYEHNVRWDPQTMVLPLTDKARDKLAQDAQAIRRAERSLLDALLPLP